MECRNSLNKTKIYQNKSKSNENIWKIFREIDCLPQLIRAPGNATIGNTPNKSITQSVAKKTFRPGLDLQNCRKNNRILCRNDGDDGCFTAGSSSIIAIQLETKPKMNGGDWFDR